MADDPMTQNGPAPAAGGVDDSAREDTAPVAAHWMEEALADPRKRKDMAQWAEEFKKPDFDSLNAQHSRTVASLRKGQPAVDADALTQARTSLVEDYVARGVSEDEFDGVDDLSMVSRIGRLALRTATPEKAETATAPAGLTPEQVDARVTESVQRLYGSKRGPVTESTTVPKDDMAAFKAYGNWETDDMEGPARVVKQAGVKL